MKKLSMLLDRAGFALACLCTFVILLLQAADILLRPFGYTNVYSTEMSGFLIAVAVFMALGDVTRKREHICADFFVAMLPARARILLDYALSLVLTLGYIAALVYILGDLAWNSHLDEVRSEGPLRLLLAIPQGIAVLGLAVMGIRLIADLLAGPRAAAAAAGPEDARRDSSLVSSSVTREA